jgi:hypothetical protein
LYHATCRLRLRSRSTRLEVLTKSNTPLFNRRFQAWSRRFFRSSCHLKPLKNSYRYDVEIFTSRNFNTLRRENRLKGVIFRKT